MVLHYELAREARRCPQQLLLPHEDNGFGGANAASFKREVLCRFAEFQLKRPSVIQYYGVMPLEPVKCSCSVFGRGAITARMHSSCCRKMPRVGVVASGS